MKTDQEQGNLEEKTWLFKKNCLTTSITSKNSLSYQIASRMPMDISLFENIKHLRGIKIKQQPAQINLTIRLSSIMVRHRGKMDEAIFFPDEFTRWVARSLQK